MSRAFLLLVGCLAVVAVRRFPLDKTEYFDFPSKWDVPTLSSSRALSEWSQAGSNITSTPVSYVIPAASDDVWIGPMMMSSVAKQTIPAAETVVIYNIHQEVTTILDIFIPPVLNKTGSGTAYNFVQSMIQLLGKSLHYTLDDKRLGSDLGCSAVLPLYKSISIIPNLRLYVRKGGHYAGSNRSYGAKVADQPWLSMFDYDDCMVPHRNEVMFRVLAAKPDHDVVLPQVKIFPFWKMNPGCDGGGGGELDPCDRESIEHLIANETASSILNSTEILERHRVAIVKQLHGRLPTQNKNNMYRFKDIHPSLAGFKFHTPSIMVRTELFQFVKYPAIRRGQDSVFLYTLLNYGCRFLLMTSALGLYISPSSEMPQYMTPNH